MEETKVKGEKADRQKKCKINEVNRKIVVVTRKKQRKNDTDVLRNKQKNKQGDKERCQRYKNAILNKLFFIVRIGLPS